MSILIRLCKKYNDDKVFKIEDVDVILDLLWVIYFVVCCLIVKDVIVNCFDCVWVEEVLNFFGFS